LDYKSAPAYLNYHRGEVINPNQLEERMLVPQLGNSGIGSFNRTVMISTKTDCQQNFGVANRDCRFSTELRGFSACRTLGISTGLGDFQQIYGGFSLIAGTGKLLSTTHYWLSKMM
jgi:hypothetical protein